MQRNYPARTRTDDGKPRGNRGGSIISPASAAESGAVDARRPDDEIPDQYGNDVGLRLQIEVWPELSDTVKNRILRLADATARAGR